MKRISIILGATVVATAPALALGMSHPAQAAGTAPSRQVQPLDDRGGHHHAEPGEDHGRHVGHAEPGDDSRTRTAVPRKVTLPSVTRVTVDAVAKAHDRGGNHAEPGDDRGNNAEPGDDRGGSRHGEPGDDRGRR